MIMKTTLVIVSAIVVLVRCREIQHGPGESEPQWMVIPDMQNRLHYLNLRQAVPRVQVADSDITFYYFSWNTKSFEMKLDSVSDISKTDFDPHRRTMFIIHGWTSNGQSEMNDLITSALLNKEDWNIFNIDWHAPASKNYISSKGSLPECARIISSFIRYLKDHAELNLDRVYVTGHSLGGQMSGRVGANFNGDIGYIIGLDPALPLFNNYENLADRLDPTDAQHVQVIHTNGGLLGYKLPLGHADFYPNGGQNQNGCTDAFGMCSHLRAYLYLAESIRSGRFLSYYCDDYSKYINGDCRENHYAHMGGCNLDTDASGSYFLETNQQKPYAIA